MVRLNLVSVGMVEETNSVILVLRAADLARLLVMEVGLLEGRAIAMEAEGVKAPRPLTHELTVDVIGKLGAKVKEVKIRDFRDRVFFADLVLESGGRLVEVDARPSDAVALAIRTGAPIFTTQQVINLAGIDEADAETESDEEDEEGNADLVDRDDTDEDEDEDEADGNIVH